MNIAFSKEIHKRWKEELNQYGILYLYAMSGYGKTVQAVEFAKNEYKKWKRIEVSDHLIEEMEQYIDQENSGRTKTLMIIDDFQWLIEKKMCESFLEKVLWTLRNNKNIHWMILGRAHLPEFLTVLKLTRQLAVEDYESLVLNREMIADIVENSGLPSKRKDLFREANIVQNHAFEMCVQISNGYPIALNAYIERLKETGVDYQTAYNLGLEDVYAYFDIHIYRVWDLRHREAMMYLSVCDFFDMGLGKVILGEEAKEIIEDMRQIGSFIKEMGNGVMKIQPIFLAFLRYKLSQIPEKERNSLYERAGEYYEKHRNIVQALECYNRAGIFDRMLGLMCYLSENADGCEFAKICYRYMEEFPKDYDERFPKLLAVKTMIYSYHMELDKSNYYLEKLKEKADEEKNSRVGNEARINYVRTLIALPHGSAEKTIHNLKYFPSFFKENGLQVRNVIATGNMPSMINGGLDLLPWGKNYKELYPIMKLGSEKIMGKEAVGIADVSVGEHLYEQGQMAKSIAYLTKGLSEANLKGSIRVQYAATGVMTRVFQADNQWDTAYDIMKNILEQAKATSFFELIPNIEASIVQMKMLKGELTPAEIWLENNPADEHGEFFITERYRLLVKTKVYIAQGRNYEALYIIELLQKYANLFERHYLKMQLQILRAICYERIGEPWKEELIEAAKASEKYGYIRILADWGVALLPMWKELMSEENFEKELGKKYITTVYKEMKTMAAYYPKNLKTQKKIAELTKKEIEVLRLIAEGNNNQEIAKNMNLSIATVKFHVSNILKKMQVDNRTSAVYLAKQEKLI